MMHWIKLLKISITPTCLAGLILFFGCSKDSKTDKYIARVDDAVLTKAMLDSSLSDKANNAKGKEEFVNDWVENEVLFNEAEKEGVTKEPEFNQLLERNKKELASALLIKKILADAKIELSEEEIQKYFDENKDSFRLQDDLLLFNMATFSDYDKAIQFRNKLLETNWNTAENIYRSDNSVTIEKGKQLYSYELQPVVVSRTVSLLNPGEASIILQLEADKFSIVQMIEKYLKESIPPLLAVKDFAKQKLSIIKQNEFIRNYINKLLSDHKIEIERYSE